MKSDMETIVARVKQEYINDQDSAQSERSHIVLQQAIIQKTQKVNELTNELDKLQDQMLRLKAERDRLIQISNDLRADLNRSQRLVNDLMSKLTNSPQNQIQPTN